MHRYEIDKRKNQWVVSIDGNDLLYCKEEKLAIRIAKEANRQFRSETPEERAAASQMGSA